MNSIYVTLFISNSFLSQQYNQGYIVLIIKVWGLPKGVTKEFLKKLRDAIIDTVEEIPELDLAGKNDTAVLFPTDSMEYGLGEEIIAEIVIFDELSRTNEVRARLAKNVSELLHCCFADAKIKCFIHPFEHYLGYYKIDPE